MHVDNADTNRYYVAKGTVGAMIIVENSKDIEVSGYGGNANTTVNITNR